MARTTRLNISVPTALQDRLKRVKDQVNVSKVCVAALERELERLEARPSVPAPQLERLIKRLQTNQDRWSERGRQDGERWAVEIAARSDLRRVGEGAPSSKGDGAAGASEPLPPSFDLERALEAWVRRDAGVKDDDLHRYADGGRRPPRFPPALEEAVQRARAQVDEGAYRTGWTAAVREIWRAVRPALQ
jgi:hypothetical protein